MLKNISNTYTIFWKGVIIIMKYAITGGFILLDILSGTASALKSKTWTSTKMREGLFHKSAIIFIIALAILCDYSQGYLNLGFHIPLVTAVLVYVCTMEIGSVLENITKIYPALSQKIKSLFITEN
jgi:phage-related holin